MGYLVESPKCEHAAIRRLESLFVLLDDMFEALGLNPEYCWFLLEVDMGALISSFRGDVDILIGRLKAADPEAFKRAYEKWKNKCSPSAHPAHIYRIAAIDVAENGGILWPPQTDYLVGVEVKCSFLSPEADEISEATIRSKKSSQKKVKKIQGQVKRLLDMGFDKVALLDFIANPPVSGIDGEAWMRAGGIASASESAMSSVLKGRLPVGSLAGHWSCSVGAVAGGDETIRGAGGTVKYREPQDNKPASDSDRYARRQEMERNISAMLGALPLPRDLPVLFINCKVCRKIHRCYTQNACDSA
jgi:hypothetical protein